MTEHIDLVKRLVKESFGSRYIPNLSTGIVPGSGFVWEESDFLVLNEKSSGKIGIGKKPLPGILSFFQHHYQIGSFLQEDGSELIVEPEFETKAKRYAILYHQATGRKVKVSTYSGCI